MGTEGKVCFLTLTISPVDASFQRAGACVAIQAVPGAHRCTQKSWVAQRNEKGQLNTGHFTVSMGSELGVFC